MIQSAVMIILCIMLASTGFAQPADDSPLSVSELRQRANAAHAQGDQELFRDTVQSLNELRPGHPQYMYQLVLANAAIGDYTRAFNTMVTMQRQGLSYDFDRSPESEPLRDKEIYDYLNDLMVRAGEPLGTVEMVGELSAEYGRLEALDWDPTRDAYLIGSVATGQLLALREGLKTEELLAPNDANGLWSINDLLVDSNRNRLWITSSATPAFKSFDVIDRGRSDLFEFELDTLKLVRRYPAPVDGLKHNLYRMVMTATGHVIMADKVQPIVYLLAAGGERLEPILASRSLDSLRGLALPGQGQSLYLADYEMGLVRLELGTGKITLVGHNDTVNLWGIDGLRSVGDDLLVIQNGIQPQRILRLELNGDGSAVVNVTPIAVADPLFDHPGNGIIHGDELVFFANSKVYLNADQEAPVRLARASVIGVGNIVQPDMQRFLEEQARQRMQPPGFQDSAEKTPDGS
jgi:hypothetical protein